MDPRQMSMMMKKLGIDVRDIEGVQQVIVRTAGKDYIFDKATVSVMKAQGVETWQVSGKPRTVEHSAVSTSGSSASASSTSPAAAPAAVTEPDYVAAPEDIALVAQETGKSPADARAALLATKGDLAEAILRLS